MSAMDLMADHDPLSGLESLIECAEDRRIAERVEPRCVLRVSYGFGIQRAAQFGLLRSRPANWVTRENGYTSRNVDRAELCMNCDFTVDGELWQPDPDRSIALSAERVVLVRA